MGWGTCGEDDEGRPIGYLIAATCDEPGCRSPIDRGLSYCCGDMHGGGDHGCGKYFCESHRQVAWHRDGSVQSVCSACYESGSWDEES